MSLKLSICIPTFNRAKYLNNLLNSIYITKSPFLANTEICISDNNSSDKTENVVKSFDDKLNINYKKQNTNIGLAKNILKVVDLAKGEFVWILGDDDLILKNSFEKINKIFKSNADVDFIYVNAYNISKEYIEKFEKPFDTKNLPQNMDKFSGWNVSHKTIFLKLINPKISFDYLGGVFLSIFKREKWINNLSCINVNKITIENSFSNLDNTFPHIKIFANAFVNSKAYFNSEPLVVCLNDVREWLVFYPFIRSIVLVEALKEYKKNGLSYLNYFICKNAILSNFFTDISFILLNKNISGYKYLNIKKILIEYLLYPNVYLSIFRYILRKLKKLISNKSIY
ncbi:glycosyltransferase family 2 protein [Candidatus Pelagibacter sp. HIMB1695]|uniref:glycosyltransferase family 2 protein n=1 Tax=Candidatus Pelagibacter sp. HIMB1695 TaxID=3413364 RepID=UPI003F85B02A